MSLIERFLKKDPTPKEDVPLSVAEQKSLLLLGRRRLTTAGIFSSSLSSRDSLINPDDLREAIDQLINKDLITTASPDGLYLDALAPIQSTKKGRSAQRQIMRDANRIRETVSVKV